MKSAWRLKSLILPLCQRPRRLPEPTAFIGTRESHLDASDFGNLTGQQRIAHRHSATTVEMSKSVGRLCARFVDALQRKPLSVYSVLFSAASLEHTEPAEMSSCCSRKTRIMQE